ncbi:hypothetical protein [Nodosilinea sp. LEGE 06152]|nr:hypothetical protein [Nodosilinea sp. LEGE 06152]
MLLCGVWQQILRSPQFLPVAARPQPSIKNPPPGMRIPGGGVTQL